MNSTPGSPGPEHGEELKELAAGFALGALDARDRERFLAHLPGCATCQELLRGYRQVTASLPWALDPREASPGLRERILTIAADNPPSAAGPAATAPVQDGQFRQAPSSPLSRLAPRWALSLAALFAVTLGLGYWNFRLQEQVRQQAAILRTQQQALSAVARSEERWTLAGTPEAPGAAATLVRPPDGSPPYLLTANLPSLPPDRTVQAWVIAGGPPTPAGLLDPAAQGTALGHLESQFSPGDIVAITIEPRGGSPSPTGPIVVSGQV